MLLAIDVGNTETVIGLFALTDDEASPLSSDDGIGAGSPPPSPTRRSPGA